MKVFVMKDARIGRRTWKRGRQPPPFFDGRGQLTVSCRPSSSRPWLSSPLSVIPPFKWVCLARTLTSSFAVAAAWHAHPMSALYASALGMVYVHHLHTGCRLGFGTSDVKHKVRKKSK